MRDGEAVGGHYRGSLAVSWAAQPPPRNAGPDAQRRLRGGPLFRNADQGSKIAIGLPKGRQLQSCEGDSPSTPLRGAREKVAILNESLRLSSVR